MNISIFEVKASKQNLFGLLYEPGINDTNNIITSATAMAELDTGTLWGGEYTATITSIPYSDRWGLKLELIISITED